MAVSDKAQRAPDALFVPEGGSPQMAELSFSAPNQPHVEFVPSRKQDLISYLVEAVSNGASGAFRAIQRCTR